jgi:hypothetical protein
MTAPRPTVRRSCRSSEVAISFAPASKEDTSASPTNPIISSKSPLWIYLESSDGVGPSPRVPAVPLDPRNDSQLKPKAMPELVSQQPSNDHKCKSMEALEAANTKADPESSSVPSSSQAVTSGSVPVMEVPASRLQQPPPVEEQGPTLAVESSTKKWAEPQAEAPTESSSAPLSSQAQVTSGSVPVVEEPASCRQQPAPVEEQASVLAVESSSEKRAQPQIGVPTEAQPSTSFKTKEVLSERQESVVQDVFPIDNNDQVREDNTNGDDDASLAPIPSIQAPEAVVRRRYDRKCKNLSLSWKLLSKMSATHRESSIATQKPKIRFKVLVR